MLNQIQALFFSFVKVQKWSSGTLNRDNHRWYDVLNMLKFHMLLLYYDWSLLINIIFHFFKEPVQMGSPSGETYPAMVFLFIKFSCILLGIEARYHGHFAFMKCLSRLNCPTFYIIIDGHIITFFHLNFFIFV